MNKAVNMPYFNADATTEHGYDENNTPILIGRFIDYSNTKIISIEDLEKLRHKNMSQRVDGLSIHLVFRV